MSCDYAVQAVRRHTLESGEEVGHIIIVIVIMMMIIKGSGRKGWTKRVACCGRDPNWYAAVRECW